MTSLRESGDVTDGQEKDMSELPPSGTSLHKRRTGEPPASLSVRGPQTPSDAEGSSPCTAGPTPEDWSANDCESADPESICDSMLQRLKDRDDLLSKRGKHAAQRAKDTVEALDQLEKLLDLLDQFVTLTDYNARLLSKIKDVTHLKRLHGAYKKIASENETMKSEIGEINQINEAIDADFECEYGQMLLDSMARGRSMKRTGSKWKGHARFRGSLLKQRSRSAGGDDSDAPPGTPLRRRSEGIFLKEVEKSKVSKWTRVKAAFRWEKAQWSTVSMGGAAGAVAAGAMVGAVALAGSSPSSATLANPDPRDSASLTPGSLISLTPNSSCEELRIDSGIRKMRCDENDNTFLHPPTQDDSSTSPSPNKLHKTPWGKMRDILQTHRESVKKKGTRSQRGSKSSPEAMPGHAMRRRSFSDGGESDAPPALTLTIPSSEELESEPHPILRKQRSLELGTRPPAHRPPRASKWTKVKRAFLTSASASVPSSPNRHSAFFTDADTEGLSSGCEASGVREEIARNYAALQTRLGREFSDRRGKLHAGSYPATRPVATEEQLSADFRKKLEEWKLKKGVKQPLPIPARQDLSDDFLKRWDEWKRMKDTNTVPTWEEEPKPDEVLVQTSTGLFKFQGISRSFTRKLHEWEKSRGIAPEASTSALLQAAKAQKKAPQAPLTRTQSDGSVAPSAAGSGRHHASSLSVNNVDDFESEYEREQSVDGIEDDEANTRGAVLVEVEDEEICTAAPLMAVSPRHTPQKPVYTYGQAEARLLCETSSAVTGTAVMQPNGAVVISEDRVKKPKETGARPKTTTREKTKTIEKSRRRISRQTSIEEDAKLIRKAIEEVERGSSRRYKEDEEINSELDYQHNNQPNESRGSPQDNTFSIQKSTKQNNLKELLKDKTSTDDLREENKRKDIDKNNGNKKKTKSRARLEREQSKPSASDTDQEVDTVTVEIPRRKKRQRRASEKPRTPPTSIHSDSEGEVFVLKLKAPEQRASSPEVIVKTTRKIFSPVVRSGETFPRAVISVDVEDLNDVRLEPSRKHDDRKRDEKTKVKDKSSLSKGSGDLQDGEEHKKRSKPPLPLSPPSQRKPQLKETAPSIRIMIQRYNKKISEEGHTSGENSGASSPAWRSPSAERRRPPDMPVGVNIRNNPFLEREVQKSASACQLSRRDQTSSEKRLAPNTPATSLDGVLKSHSANALLPNKRPQSPELVIKKIEDSQETIVGTSASIDTIVPDLTKNLPKFTSSTTIQSLPVMRQFSESVTPTYSRLTSDSPSVSSSVYGRSVSTVEAPVYPVEPVATVRISERAARLKAARDRFLLSSGSMRRREGTSSASDLRRIVDRSSKISCDSDVAESQSSSSQTQDSNLGRSASTGMVNVDQEAWQRVAEGSRREGRSRSRFSLARLAAKLRRGAKDESAVSRLCRQSLLVQLINKQ